MSGSTLKGNKWGRKRQLRQVVGFFGQSERGFIWLAVVGNAKVKGQ